LICIQLTFSGIKKNIDGQVAIAHDELNQSLVSEGEHDQMHLTHAMDNILQTMTQLPTARAAPRELSIGSSQDAIIQEIEPEDDRDLHE